jgi:hypothetical protein
MIKHINDLNEHTKHILDWSSVITVLGTLTQILPGIAALWTIIWTTIRIWETKTVQGLVKKFKKQNAEQE